MQMSNVPYLKTRMLPIVGALALAGALSFGLSACDGANGKSLDAAPANPGAVISAAAVLERQVTEKQEFSGRMEAIEHVEIRARVGGYITAVNMQPGRLVKKGDLLFIIDPRLYQAEVNRTEAAAAAARAKVELAKTELVRAERLFADRAIAQREVDTTTSIFKELDASARAAEAQFETAKLNLSYTRVIAPIDGRVGKAEITLGNLIDPATALTSIVSDDRIYASFDGDEATFLRVGTAARRGQVIDVQVGLANETGFPHEGKLEFVDNQLDPQTGGVRMRAVFANKDKILAPGLFARVQLQASGTTQVMLINERAIGTDQSRKFVYIVSADGKAEYRQVTLGPVVDGLRVVRSGLKAGDNIVVNGLKRVQSGAALAPHMVSMDSDLSDVPVDSALEAKKTAAKSAPVKG
jgi:multidrug efflux system membrane fusion protein